MKSYTWKPGVNIKIKAHVAAKRLEKIRKKQKGKTLTPDVVVADAESVSSPLHRVFEWSDRKAGAMYRLDQARYLIRSIVVEYEGRPAVRAFVSIVVDHEPSYTTIELAINEPVLREQIIERAKRELESWRQRYSDLVEFAGIYDAMDKLDG